MKRHAMKALAALLTLVLAFGLAACGSTSEPSGETSAGGTPSVGSDGEVYESAWPLPRPTATTWT